MAATVNTQVKKQSKTRTSKSQSARQGRGFEQQASNSSQPSALSSMVDTMLATANFGSEIKGTIEHLARAVDSMTMGDASKTVGQVQDTIEQATITYTHAKETFELGKVAFDSVKGTAKDVFAKVRENPEPIIAAAVPALLGLYMIFRRSQTSRLAPPARRNSSQRQINA